MSVTLNRRSVTSWYKPWGGERELPLTIRPAPGTFIETVRGRENCGRIPAKSTKHYFQTDVPAERIWAAPHMETNPGLKGSVTVNYCETGFIPISNSVGTHCFGETVSKCSIFISFPTHSFLTVNSGLFSLSLSYCIVIYYCVSFLSSGNHVSPDVLSLLRDGLFLSPTS